MTKCAKLRGYRLLEYQTKDILENLLTIITFQISLCMCQDNNNIISYLKKRYNNIINAPKKYGKIQLNPSNR